MSSLSVLRLFFSDRSVKKVFSPIIAEYQNEVFAAIKESGGVHLKIRQLKYKYAGALVTAAFGAFASRLLPVASVRGVSSFFPPVEEDEQVKLSEVSPMVGLDGVRAFTFGQCMALLTPLGCLCFGAEDTYPGTLGGQVVGRSDSSLLVSVFVETATDRFVRRRVAREMVEVAFLDRKNQRRETTGDAVA